MNINKIEKSIKYDFAKQFFESLHIGNDVISNETNKYICKDLFNYILINFYKFDSNYYSYIYGKKLLFDITVFDNEIILEFRFWYNIDKILKTFIFKFNIFEDICKFLIQHKKYMLFFKKFFEDKYNNKEFIQYFANLLNMKVQILNYNLNNVPVIDYNFF